MLDIQVTPTTSSVSVDTATGQVTPTCNAGVVNVTAAGQALPLSQLNALGSTIQEVLTQLGATPLGTVIDQLLNFQPDGVLSCTPGTTAGGTSGTATADSVDLNLAPAVNLLSLDLGNVDASASDLGTTPGVAYLALGDTPAAPAGGWQPAPAGPQRDHGAHRRVLGGAAADRADGRHGSGRARPDRPAPHRLGRPCAPSDLSPPGWPMSHSTDPVTGSGRTATGPGLRDLLRSPSGFGGRPGGSHAADQTDSRTDTDTATTTEPRPR